jgi:hypothetical protein
MARSYNKNGEKNESNMEGKKRKRGHRTRTWNSEIEKLLELLERVKNWREMEN